jgi:hypothetical protein
MGTWLTSRLKGPSPAMVVAIVALVFAMGGTAVAASAIVNIADPTHPSNKAKVDSTGALRVGEAAPKDAFFASMFIPSGVDVLIAPNSATVSLSRLSFENRYSQTDGAAASFTLYQRSGDVVACDDSEGSLRMIGTYDVPAGQTYSDAMASPIVLRPLLTGDTWCLIALVSIDGNPHSYLEPSVSWSGFVQTGSLPAPIISREADGTPPRVRA